MVWQLLQFSLQYLQIDALRERVASTVLAETRCDRAPDGQSDVLACARVSNEHQSKASVHRASVSLGHSVNRVYCSVTHFINDVAGSGLVIGLGCSDGTPMLIILLVPLRLLLSSIKIPPFSFMYILIRPRGRGPE